MKKEIEVCDKYQSADRIKPTEKQLNLILAMEEYTVDKFEGETRQEASEWISQYWNEYNQDRQWWEEED